MKIELFTNVLFENKKVMLSFVILCIALTFYVTIQTVFVTNSITENKSKPDMVFFGATYVPQDGSYPFKAYNSISKFTNPASEIIGDRADHYAGICRSIYNYYDEVTSVGFSGRVYGMSNEFLDKYLGKFIEEGRLPKFGEQEAVVGYYFAHRFGLSVGDPIPQTVTLNEKCTEEDNNQYKVSGILFENVSSYFNGSVVISKETFEELVGMNEDNILIGYFLSEDEDSNKEVFLQLNSISQQYGVPEGTLHYTQKQFSMKKIYSNIALYLLISSVLLFSLVSYLMKGLTHKIGLLKAIGFSTTKILQVFIGGLLIVVLISVIIGIVVSMGAVSLMNNYVSNFYQFDIHMYSINNIYVTYFIIGEVAMIILSLFGFILQKCLTIDPKVAMMTIQ